MNNILEQAIINYDKKINKYINVFEKILDNKNIKYNKSNNKGYIDYLYKKILSNLDSNEEKNNNIFSHNFNIISYNYFNLGLLHLKYYNWYWFWSIFTDKNMTYKSQQLLLYGLNIDISVSNQNRFIRSLLINSKFHIEKNTYDNMMLIIKALSLYLTNSDIIIELYDKDKKYLTIIVIYNIKLNINTI